MVRKKPPLTEQWLKYHRDWGKRNPECVKKYRQRNAKFRYDPRLHSEEYRKEEYWQLRWEFESKNDDLSAVIFPDVNDLLKLDPCHS